MVITLPDGSIRILEPNEKLETTIDGERVLTVMPKDTAVPDWKTKLDALRNKLEKK